MQMQIKLLQLIHSIGGLTKLQDLHEFCVEAEDSHRIDMRYIQGSLVPQIFIMLKVKRVGSCFPAS